MDQRALDIIQDVDRGGEKRGIAIGEERGEKRGRAVGRQEGEHLSRVKSARNCLQKGFTIQTICDILTVNEDDSAFWNEVRQIEGFNK
jgi:predicted transposase YdaD